MLQTPRISWDSDPSALYTVFIVDIDIFRPNDPNTRNFLHYMATNVPGGKVYLLIRIYAGNEITLSQFQAMSRLAPRITLTSPALLFSTTPIR